MVSELKSSLRKKRTVHLIGTVGVPAQYGGFETLVENLVDYHSARDINCDLTVYCQKSAYKDRLQTYKKSKLIYVPLLANGKQSVLYDIMSMVISLRSRADVICLLGVSGAIFLPLLRLISSSTIICNVDGVEWRREKWKGVAKWFLKLCERLAARYSHVVISDNEAIREHIKLSYGVDSLVIEYGGEHALKGSMKPVANNVEVRDYYLKICRIEPENNIRDVLEAFRVVANRKLVIVGNWNSSPYGVSLKSEFSGIDNILILDPIYDSDRLFQLRSNAAAFVHGHSAGGTNPSLVEAMHFGVPILAFDCTFNRYTTENKAVYFSGAQSLIDILCASDESKWTSVGQSMKEIADRRYTWDKIGSRYFNLFTSDRYVTSLEKAQGKL